MTDSPLNTLRVYRSGTFQNVPGLGPPQKSFEIDHGWIQSRLFTTQMGAAIEWSTAMGCNAIKAIV